MTRECAECEYFLPQDRKNENCYCKERKSYVDGNNSVCGSFKLDRYRSYSEIQETKKYCQKYQASGCYITTLIVSLLKMKDDCYELNALRFLRNEVMQKRPEYIKLLVEYDALGPIISKYLVHRVDNFEFAKTLYNVYIKYCIFLIEKKRYDEAVDFYVEMFNQLKIQAISSYMIPEDIENKLSSKSLGHGKIGYNSVK